MVLYSSNEVPFTSWEDKDEGISSLGEIIDLSLYEQNSIDGEVSFILKDSIFKENEENFLKEMSNVIESKFMCIKEKIEDYVEEDSIGSRLSIGRDNLGVDVDYLRIWQIPYSELELIKVMERAFRTDHGNILKGTLSFYILQIVFFVMLPLII